MAKSRKVLASYWLVQQGMRDPRNVSQIGWRDYETYAIDNELAARQDLKRLGAIARLSRVEVVAAIGCEGA